MFITLKFIKIIQMITLFQLSSKTSSLRPSFSLIKLVSFISSSHEFNTAMLHKISRSTLHPVALQAQLESSLNVSNFYDRGPLLKLTKFKLNQLNSYFF